MAEVFLEFAAIAGPAGRSYLPRACGRTMEDGRRWEGWIEFIPVADGPALRTTRETVQPNREDLTYWATGISRTYLEGALTRALEPRPEGHSRSEEARPAFDGPAPERSEKGAVARPSPRPRAVLDPFRVHAQGEAVLRQELGALEADHLRNIVRTYGLEPVGELDPNTMGKTALTELIIAAVRRRNA